MIVYCVICSICFAIVLFLFFKTLSKNRQLKKDLEKKTHSMNIYARYIKNCLKEEAKQKELEERIQKAKDEKDIYSVISDIIIDNNQLQHN